MANTFTSLTYHIVFSTKNREPWILEPITTDLYRYIGGIIDGQGGLMLEIGGISDHVHILTTIPAKVSVSDMLRAIKANSSKWINEEKTKIHKFGWQDGYVAFTVSKSGNPAVRKYIRNQRIHHANWDYRSELIVLLTRHEIEYDERYLE